jgi:hypothetical protein
MIDHPYRTIQPREPQKWTREPPGLKMWERGQVTWGKGGKGFFLHLRNSLGASLNEAAASFLGGSGHLRKAPLCGSRWPATCQCQSLLGRASLIGAAMNDVMVFRAS